MFITVDYGILSSINHIHKCTSIILEDHFIIDYIFFLQKLYIYVFLFNFEEDKKAINTRKGAVYLQYLIAQSLIMIRAYVQAFINKLFL